MRFDLTFICGADKKVLWGKVCLSSALSLCIVKFLTTQILFCITQNKRFMFSWQKTINTYKLVIPLEKVSALSTTLSNTLVIDTGPSE